MNQSEQIMTEFAAVFDQSFGPMIDDLKTAFFAGIEIIIIIAGFVIILKALDLLRGSKDDVEIGENKKDYVLRRELNLQNLQNGSSERIKK